MGPTLTPMSIASTAPGPLAATTGRMISVAGRLLTRLATSALSAATATRVGSPSPPGTSASIAEPIPPSLAACTTTPSASTKTSSDGSTARATSRGGGRSRSVMATAPAAATHTASTPTNELRPEAEQGRDEHPEREARHLDGRSRLAPRRPAERDA